MEIRKLNQSEVFHFKSLIGIFIEVFENTDTMPSEEYLSKLLQNSDFFVLVASVDSRIVGGLSVYVLHSYYAEKPVAYIYDVGILPQYQRQGIGKSLITYLSQYCIENGFQEAYVEAETDDLDAVNFYRKTNFSHELQATHFTYFFGEELS
jgi:aminoglycoside 3-N-acetyltransferase I